MIIKITSKNFTTIEASKKPNIKDINIDATIIELVFPFLKILGKLLSLINLKNNKNPDKKTIR